MERLIGAARATRVVDGVEGTAADIAGTATTEADALITDLRTHDTDAKALAWRMSKDVKARLADLATRAPAEFQRVENELADWRAKINAGAA